MMKKYRVLGQLVKREKLDVVYFAEGISEAVSKANFDYPELEIDRVDEEH